MGVGSGDATRPGSGDGLSVEIARSLSLLCVASPGAGGWSWGCCGGGGLEVLGVRATAGMRVSILLNMCAKRDWVPEPGCALFGVFGAAGVGDVG